jgi:hypothetical protein
MQLLHFLKPLIWIANSQVIATEDMTYRQIALMGVKRRGTKGSFGVLLLPWWEWVQVKMSGRSINGLVGYKGACVKIDEGDCQKDFRECCACQKSVDCDTCRATRK